MRKIRQQQLALVPVSGHHAHAKELDAISVVLDRNPELAALVARDVVGDVRTDWGRPGMSGDQVLRAAILKQMDRHSYEMLAFHLGDSASYRRFCRIEYGREPSAATLQRNIARISAETWEAINRRIVAFAVAERIERGDRTRTDCTVVASNIHRPDDAWLMWDVVRVSTRLLQRAEDGGIGVVFCNRKRRAKRRLVEIQNARNRRVRKPPYRDLIRVTEEVLGCVRAGLRGVGACPERWATRLAAKLRGVLEQGERVVDQARRRVLHGEKVPATEKTVSIFEPHSDIIIKDFREVYYGHKVCMTGGASGLWLDVVTERGNPGDSTMVERTVRRTAAVLGRVPRQMAFDGGFASRANLMRAKELGVEDLCFAKGRGLTGAEMVRSPWVFRRLRKFRAGIEGQISFAKRAFGLGRCTWRGFPAFKAYVWASVVACNLLTLARHRLE